MNTVAEQSAGLAIGAAIAGGFYAGSIRVGDQVYGLIVAPKSEGDHDDIAWNKSLKKVEGAQFYFDGRANTQAMAEAGSKAAQWALGLKINGHDDWYIPSRDELELVYRNLKPGKEENYTYRHGENPSSVPVGYPYTEDAPGQTEVEAFRSGGAEAMEEAWYWTSTQYASDPALPGSRSSPMAASTTASSRSPTGSVLSAGFHFSPSTIQQFSGGHHGK